MTRHKVIEVTLLLLALLPAVGVAVMAVRIWFLGAPVELWHAPAWGLYLLQILSLFTFAAHILANDRLKDGQSGEWLWELVMYQQIAMLGYWAKHVVGQQPKLRP